MPQCTVVARAGKRQKEVVVDVPKNVDTGQHETLGDWIASRALAQDETIDLIVSVGGLVATKAEQEAAAKAGVTKAGAEQ